jgi:hypothetical protein
LDTVEVYFVFVSAGIAKEANNEAKAKEFNLIPGCFQVVEFDGYIAVSSLKWHKIMKYGLMS